MKAKLFLVTQGKFSERVIASGTDDAKKSITSKAMGARKAKLLEHVYVFPSESGVGHDAFSIDNPGCRIPYCTLSNAIYHFFNN